jgi:hypothetical protein
MILDVATTRHVSWRLVVACGAHTCLEIPPKRSHTVPCCLITAKLVLMTWHILCISLGRPCYMIWEVVMARYRSWRHVVACGANACLHIPPKGPYTAPYCLITAKFDVDDVAYII